MADRLKSHPCIGDEGLLHVLDIECAINSTGQVSGGPPPLNNRDKQVFANALDRFLARHLRSR